MGLFVLVTFVVLLVFGYMLGDLSWVHIALLVLLSLGLAVGIYALGWSAWMWIAVMAFLDAILFIKLFHSR